MFHLSLRILEEMLLERSDSEYLACIRHHGLTLSWCLGFRGNVSFVMILFERINLLLTDGYCSKYTLPTALEGHRIRVWWGWKGSLEITQFNPMLEQGH